MEINPKGVKNMLTSGPVVVMQVPEQFNAGAVQIFMEELGPLLDSNRPRIVLDCSQVRSMDSVGVEALLQCLEEALKRDGDLKLASLSPEAEVILELMRIARVFEAFKLLRRPCVVSMPSQWMLHPKTHPGTAPSLVI